MTARAGRDDFAIFEAHKRREAARLAEAEAGNGTVGDDTGAIPERRNLFSSHSDPKRREVLDKKKADGENEGVA